MRWIRDAELRNIDEELIVQGAATDKHWEVVTATVGKSVADANFFALDNGWQKHKIADGFVASGVSDVANFEIVDRNALTGIKRAAGRKKRKLKTVIGSEPDVARPNRGNGRACVDFGRNMRNASNFDTNTITNNGQIFRLGFWLLDWFLRNHILLL